MAPPAKIETSNIKAAGWKARIPQASDQKITIKTKTPENPVCGGNYKDTAAISASAKELPGPVYNPHSKRTSSVESTASYLDIIADPGIKDKGKAIAQRRNDFARKIFDTLVEKGVIKSGAKFETWWGLFGVGGKIEELIADSDFDGYFDLRADALFSRLGKEGVLQGNRTSFDNALSSITSRYFKEDFGNRAVLQYAIDSGGNFPWAGAAKTGILLRFQAEHNLAKLAKAHAGPAASQKDLKAFTAHIREKYAGKLCANPELQAQFMEEVRAYVADNFCDGFDDGIQIDVDDNFVLTPENAGRLSRSAEGKYRADCQVYAQAYRLLFAAAGLKTEHYGTYLNNGAAWGGHIQVVGYLPGENFMAINNNRNARSYARTYSSANADRSIRDLLKRDFGPGVEVYKSIPGIKSQGQAVIMMADDYAKNQTRALLQNCFATYIRFNGGMKFIAESNSTLEIVARVTAYGNENETNRLFLLGQGFTPENQTASLLKGQYLPQADRMLNLLAQAEEAMEGMGQEDYPLVLTFEVDGKSKSYSFDSPQKLKALIEFNTATVQRYQKKINGHLANLSGQGTSFLNFPARL